MLRYLPALFLLAACGGDDPEKEAPADGLDCAAMCVYLCAQAPEGSGMNVADCNAQCAQDAAPVTECGECWAVSGGSDAWVDAALLVDCVCWDAPDTEGCEDVEVDPASCSDTCRLFSGLF